MAEVEFWKMHGSGNDYILVDGWSYGVSEDALGMMAASLCRRRFSVGADGLILAGKPESEDADVRMRMFNADGSEAEMCGNGIRCLAKFVYEKRIVEKHRIVVETLAGLMTLELEVEDSKVRWVKVDMGKSSFNRSDLPMMGEGDFIDEEINISGSTFKASCVSMGNPHCVVFVEGLEDFPVERWGPLIEKHPLFPDRVNVEFAEDLGDSRIKVRTWERGCGETLACGTGACAVTAVAEKLGRTRGEAEILLRGGILKVKVRDGRLIMEGPAEKVYEGIISDKVFQVE